MSGSASQIATTKVLIIQIKINLEVMDRTSRQSLNSHDGQHKPLSGEHGHTNLDGGATHVNLLTSCTLVLIMSFVSMENQSDCVAIPLDLSLD